MKQKRFKRVVFFFAMTLLTPIMAWAQIDCTTARPNISVSGSGFNLESIVTLSESNQKNVSITVDTQSCYVKTLIPDDPHGAYQFVLTYGCTCFDGAASDVWIYATSGSTQDAYYWYTLSRGWKRSFTPVPAFEGPLYTIDNLPILSASDLPAGSYTVTLAIDQNQDQLLNKSFSSELGTLILQDRTRNYDYQGDCIACHNQTDSPNLHHALVNSKGMACVDCHVIIDMQLDIQRDCHTCHDQPEKSSVTYPRAVKDMTTTERHHLKSGNEGWDCSACH